MGVMTQNDPLTLKSGTNEPEGSRRVKGGVHIFEGAALGLDSNNFARPYVIADTFIGHAAEEVDNRVDPLTGGTAVDGGSDGNLRVKHFAGEYVAQVPLPSGMTEANIGAAIHAVNDNFRDNASSGGTSIGKLTDIQNGLAEVRFTGLL